jgi:hypothetical protein
MVSSRKGQLTRLNLLINLPPCFEKF